MIDPRIKGFLSRLAPSMLAASIVIFCLFALMAAMISVQKPTHIISPVKVSSGTALREITYVSQEISEPLPEQTKLKPIENPSDLKLSWEDVGYEKINVPPVQVIHVEEIPTIKLNVNSVLDRDVMLLTGSNPIYPYSAERDKIEGHVIVAMNVNREGRVDDVWVVEASPIGYFEDQALRAAKKFKYQPRIENGKKVMASNLRYRWDFDLPKP